MITIWGNNYYYRRPFMYFYMRVCTNADLKGFLNVLRNQNINIQKTEMISTRMKTF